MKLHQYAVSVRWTGNEGSGTTRYTGYSRAHEISAVDKPIIEGSSDAAFRGDPRKYTPESLLVASLSQCHMLWYLHLCTVAKVVVTTYADHATGAMTEHDDGSGEFTEVVLHPSVTVSDESMVQRGLELHAEVHRYCFIARSMNFPVRNEPVVRLQQ